MKSGLGAIPDISPFVRRKLDDELVFAVKDALTVIQSCTRLGIAVLGIEIFPGLNVSTYDLGMESPRGVDGWHEFVRVNNALAEEFIRKQDQKEAESDCVLTTASWSEFCGIPKRSF